jgi:hypothetical protein
MDPDPAIFTITLQEANKKLILKNNVSTYYLPFEDTLTSIFTDKSPKEVTKQVLFDNSRIQIEIHTYD